MSPFPHLGRALLRAETLGPGAVAPQPGSPSRPAVCSGSRGNGRAGPRSRSRPALGRDGTEGCDSGRSCGAGAGTGAANARAGAASPAAAGTALLRKSPARGREARPGCSYPRLPPGAAGDRMRAGGSGGVRSRGVRPVPPELAPGPQGCSQHSPAPSGALQPSPGPGPITAAFLILSQPARDSRGSRSLPGKPRGALGVRHICGTCPGSIVTFLRPRSELPARRAVPGRLRAGGMLAGRV